MFLLRLGNRIIFVAFFLICLLKFPFNILDSIIHHCMRAASDQQTKSQLSKKLDRHLSNPPQIAQRCPLHIQSSALWWAHFKGEGPDIQLIFWTDGQCFLSKPNTWRRPQTYYASACHLSSRCEAGWVHPGRCRL